MPYCSCGLWAGEESWRTMCRGCFKAMKEGEEAAKDRLIERLQGENAQLRIEKNALLHGKVVSMAFPPEKLQKLIMLCHPDKHNGSAMSTEITQWLLVMRK